MLDPFAAVERRRHVIVAAQALHDEVVHVGVVLDDEDARPPGGGRYRARFGRLRLAAGEPTDRRSVGSGGLRGLRPGLVLLPLLLLFLLRQLLLLVLFLVLLATL